MGARQTNARVTRIPGAVPPTYLTTFIRYDSTSPLHPFIVTAARYTDAATPVWQWRHDGAWRIGPVTPGVAFDYDQVVSSVTQQVAWHDGKVVIFSSNNSGLYETIYYDNTSTFSDLHQIVNVPLLIPTSFGESPFAVGVDGDNKLWLAYTINGTTITILSRAAGSLGNPWILAGSFTGPSKSIPVGINFVNGNCLPVIFVERTIEYPNPDPRPDEARLYAISPNVPYWSGESVLSVNPPPAGVTLDNEYLEFVNTVSNDTPYTLGPTFPGGVGVDADGYVYAPNMAWSATTIHPPLINGMPAPMNYTWGSRYFDASIFAQGAAVDRLRHKVYIANRATGGSDEDLLPSPYNGKITIWDTSLRTTNCGWSCSKCGQCPPPSGFFDSRCIGQPTEPIAGLGWPSDVAVDQTHDLLYVAEGMECKIHVYHIGGINPEAPPTYLYSFGSRGSGNNQFMFVKGIDVDANGNVFAVDCGNSRIQKWFRNPTTGRVDGTVPYIWGTPGRGEGQFINPVGLDIDDILGRVYVTDPVNGRVQAFDTNGAFLFQFSKFAGSPNADESLSGLGGVGSDDAGTFFIGINENLVRFRHLPD